MKTLVVIKEAFEKDKNKTIFIIPVSQKALMEASYRVSYQIAKQEKPHNIGETLIKACAGEMVDSEVKKPTGKKKSAIFTLDQNSLQLTNCPHKFSMHTV